MTTRHLATAHHRRELLRWLQIATTAALVAASLITGWTA